MHLLCIADFLHRRGREGRCWNVDCWWGQPSRCRCDRGWQQRVWSLKTVNTLSKTWLETLVWISQAFAIILIKRRVACYRVFLGSNSDYVLHNALCPVAVVRHVEENLKVHDPLNSTGGTRKIVIAVDESREVLQLSISPFRDCTLC